MFTETTPERPTRPHRARRFFRDATIAIVSLGAGLGVVAITQRDDGDDPAFLTDDRASVSELPLPAVEDGAQSTPTTVEQSHELAPIDDPTRALTTFLDAERRDDFERSYALLVTEDLEQFPSYARWQGAHRGLPEVTSFGPVVEIERSADRVTFRVDLALRPRLDETVGVIAARATGSFVARQVGDGEWRIAFSESSLTPHYPDPSGARAAAVTWASARQRCERSAEWEGGLLGIAAQAHADSLCDTTAAVRAGEPVSLDHTSGTEPVLAAFGPEASIWARVVRVSGPSDLDVVTAPLGEEWVVVGVLQTSTAAP